MPIFKMDDVNLYYKVMGQGPTIIFVHPPGLTSICFENEALLLCKNHKTILIDIRGHGRSTASANPITYQLVADDFIRFMDYIGVQQAFFCGYSMGGSIVLELLLRYPRRALGGVLIGGFSEATDFRLKSKISVGIALSNRGTYQTLALGLAASHATSAKLFWETFRDVLRCHIPNVRQYYQNGLQYHVTKRLSQIRVPVLLIYGEKDTAFHFYSKLLKEKLAHAALVLVPGAGHRIPIFYSKELVEMITAFIRKSTNIAR